MKKFCVCGGGSLGHVIAGFLSHKGHSVNVLTGHPMNWTKNLTIYLPNKESIHSTISIISSEPKDVLEDVDYVILCLPGYLIEETIQKIIPFLSSRTVVGSVVSSNGFFWIAESILPKGVLFFGFQRVPFIARVIEYGKSAELKGFKPLLKVAIQGNGNKIKICKDLEDFFDTPVELLKNIWPAALTNSNPLLHTARLYSLFKDYSKGDFYEEEPLFYEEWDQESSNLLIAMDAEFQKIIKSFPIEEEEIPSLLTYYDSHDSKSLTKKLKSINAFKDIRLKMKKEPNGYIPDWENRYFTEDIPFGLLIIKDFAEHFKIKTPNIDKVIYWVQKNMNKKYLVEGELNGEDIKQSGIPSNYVRSIEKLL